MRVSRADHRRDPMDRTEAGRVRAQAARNYEPARLEDPSTVNTMSSERARNRSVQRTRRLHGLNVRACEMLLVLQWPTCPTPQDLVRDKPARAAPLSYQRSAQLRRDRIGRSHRAEVSAGRRARRRQAGRRQRGPCREHVILPFPQVPAAPIQTCVRGFLGHPRPFPRSHLLKTRTKSQDWQSLTQFSLNLNLVLIQLYFDPVEILPAIIRRKDCVTKW